MPGSFQLPHCQTWGQGLPQFPGLLFVCDDPGRKESAASDFKRHIVLAVLDLDRFGIVWPGWEQEALRVLSFVRHGCEAGRVRSRHGKQ